MTFWLLVTLLATLFNTAALLYWQKANEARLDVHQKMLEEIAGWIRAADGSLDVLDKRVELLEKKK